MKTLDMRRALVLSSAVWLVGLSVGCQSTTQRLAGLPGMGWLDRGDEAALLSSSVDVAELPPPSAAAVPETLADSNPAPPTSQVQQATATLGSQSYPTTQYPEMQGSGTRGVPSNGYQTGPYPTSGSPDNTVGQSGSHGALPTVGQPQQGFYGAESDQNTSVQSRQSRTTWDATPAATTSTGLAGNTNPPAGIYSRDVPQASTYDHVSSNPGQTAENGPATAWPQTNNGFDSGGSAAPHTPVANPIPNAYSASVGQTDSGVTRVPVSGSSSSAATAMASHDNSMGQVDGSGTRSVYDTPSPTTAQPWRPGSTSDYSGGSTPAASLAGPSASTSAPRPFFPNGTDNVSSPAGTTANGSYSTSGSGDRNSQWR